MYTLNKNRMEQGPLFGETEEEEYLILLESESESGVILLTRQLWFLHLFSLFHFS